MCTQRDIIALPTSAPAVAATRSRAFRAQQFVLPSARPQLGQHIGNSRSIKLRGAMEALAAAAASPPPPASGQTGCHLCTSLTAPTVAGMLEEAREAVEAGATIVELRVDYLRHFEPEIDLQQLLAECPLPCIVTYRPSWEG